MLFEKKRFPDKGLSLFYFIPIWSCLVGQRTCPKPLKNPYISVVSTCPISLTKKRQALLYWLVFIYSWKDGYPRLPPLPPRFDSALRLRVDKFSSLFFKNRAILSSKVSFGLKFPFERTSLERSPWRVGRLE